MAITVTSSQRSSRWFDRLTIAQRELDREKAKWRRNRALLLGLPPQGIKDWKSVNLAWAAFATLVGNCYQQVADGIVRETRGTTANIAKILTSASRDDFEQMRLRYFARLAILDVMWAGTGVVMEKMLGDVTLAVNKFTEMDEKGKEKETEYTTPTLENQSWALTRIHPAAILRDPMGTMPDFSDMKWLAFDYFPTVKELTEGPYKISATLLKKLPKLRQNPNFESSIDYTRPTTVSEDDSGDPEFEHVCCREVWDRVNRIVRYFPKYSDEEIWKRDWPVELEYNRQLRFPLGALFFNEHPDTSYAIPELEMAAPQFEQFALLFRQILKDASIKWRKVAYRADLFDQAQINKIVNEPGTSLIPVRTNSIGDPAALDIGKSALFALQDPHVQTDQVNTLGMVKSVLHEIVGAGDFAQGGFRNTRSATEAAQLSQFLGVRMNARTENLDAFHRELLINHILYLQKTMTEERVAEVTDEQGVASWQQYKQEDIQGTFKFSVIAGSSKPLNTEVHRQESMGFFQQAVGPVTQQGGNLEPLIRWAAPLFHMPEHMVDQIFSGHKQALIALAKLIQQAHTGKVKPTPDQLWEVASAAVSTGLSQADMQALMQQQPGAGGGVPPPSQPTSLPGTNPEDQTVPS